MESLRRLCLRAATPADRAGRADSALVLMIVAYQIAALLNRERAPLNTVSLAGLALLVCNPEELFDRAFNSRFLPCSRSRAGRAVFRRTTTPLREALDDLDDKRRD